MLPRPPHAPVSNPGAAPLDGMPPIVRTAAPGCAATSGLGRSRPWVAGVLALMLGVGQAPWGVAEVLAQGASGDGSTPGETQNLMPFKDWQFNPSNNSFQVQLSPGQQPKYFLLARPMRVVVDLPQMVVETPPPPQVYGGAVRRVTVSQFTPTVVRVVLELAPNAVLLPNQVELMALEGTRWQVRPLVANPEAFLDLGPGDGLTGESLASTGESGAGVAVGSVPADLPGTVGSRAAGLGEIPTQPLSSAPLGAGISAGATSGATSGTSAGAGAIGSTAIEGRSLTPSPEVNEAVRQVLAERMAAFNGVRGVNPGAGASPGGAESGIPLAVEPAPAAGAGLPVLAPHPDLVKPGDAAGVVPGSGVAPGSPMPSQPVASQPSPSRSVVSPSVEPEPLDLSTGAVSAEAAEQLPDRESRRSRTGRSRPGRASRDSSAQSTGTGATQNPGATGSPVTAETLDAIAPETLGRANLQVVDEGGSIAPSIAPSGSSPGSENLAGRPGGNPSPNPTAANPNPGVDPGVNLGANPGVDPGANPGVNLGVNPGVNLGANPGVNPTAPQSAPSASFYNPPPPPSETDLETIGQNPAPLANIPTIPFGQPVTQALTPGIAPQGIPQGTPQTVNPGVAQTATQGISQGIPQTVTPATAQAVGQPISQPITEAITQLASQPVDPSIVQQVRPSASQSIPPTVNPANSQGIPQTVTQGIPQTVTQAIPQTVTPGIPQTVTQAIPQTVNPVSSQGIPQTVTQAIPQNIPQGVTPPIVQPFGQPLVVTPAPRPQDLGLPVPLNVVQESPRDRANPPSIAPSVAPIADRPPTSRPSTPVPPPLPPLTPQLTSPVAPPVVSSPPTIAPPQPLSLDLPVTPSPWGQPLPVLDPNPGLSASPGTVVAVNPTAIPSVPLQAVPLDPATTPLPPRRDRATNTPAAPNPNVILPKDTEMTLRYTGNTPLALDRGETIQEVLVVVEDVWDPFNRLVLPAGSQIIGRFEVDGRGSRFIAQAIAFAEGNRTLTASSGPIRGDRQGLGKSIGIGTGIGATAGIILSGGLGLLGGAAAGAATGYLFAPQSLVIEPNQVLTIRLQEDWQ